MEESFRCCSIGDDRHPHSPCHKHSDCVNNSPPPSQHDNRRKMMRQRGTIKKVITMSAFLLTMQILIFGCRALSDHDESINSQQQRRLQGNSLWLPDTSGLLRCTNDQKKEPWMPTHKTISDCCQRNFYWDEPTCNQNSGEWFSESMNPFAGAPKQQYYPDSSAGICRPNSPEKPVWINILVSSYRQCCEEHIPWDVENCVKNEPVAENVSAPKQQYYPDSSAGFCKPNSPEKPVWINILVSSYRQCCEEHLPYHFEKCLENEPVIENEPETNPYLSAIGPTTPDPTTSPTESPYKGFYADPSLRKCLPNSPSKPAWNKDVALTRLDCCKKYLDWAFIECVADIPPTLRPTSAEGNMLDRTTSSPTETPYTYSGFYAEDVSRSCLPNSADRPEWNTNIAPTHLECCKKYLDWAFAECVRNIAPSLRPTQTPTTAKPTEAPFTAEPTISSVPTSRPTTSPTTLYWKPTIAPITSSPTNQPTKAIPTIAPTTSAPTRSPATILYYADTALSYCLEDSLDRPQWNQDFTTDYTECCKTLLPWVYGDCMKMKPVDTFTTTTSSTALNSSTEAALVTRDPTSSPTKTRYYADTTLSRCIEDSITRPSWIEESALESDYSQCCKIHLDWVYDACMKHAPKEPVTEEEMVEVDATVPVAVDCPSLRQRKCKRNVSCVWLKVPQRRCEYKDSQNSAASSTATTTTTVATTTPSLYKYYVNTINGKCLIHTADTPSWVTIHKNFEECCDASWFDNCKEFIPMAPMSEAVGSNEEEHKVIEVVARGTLNLYFQATLPSPSSLEWTRLIKALRETFMTIFQESEQYHPEIELTLVSLGYTSLMQRLLSSALEPAEDGGQHRQLQELTKLEFELTIPILCNSDCQMNTWNVGLDTFEIMERHFLESANSGVFTTLLFESGKELGIFSATTDAPVAGDAKLTYQYSFSSKKTWMPSPGPTSLKIEEEPAADEEVEVEVEVELDLEFYPDYVNDVCKSDGNPPDYEDNFFDTLEDCCNFAWIHYATCKKNSVVVTRPPTPNPTRVPTRVPTQKPTPKPSPKPTSDSIQQNSGAACSLISRRRQCNRTTGCKWKFTASGNYCDSATAFNGQPTIPSTPFPTRKPSAEPTSKPQNSKPTTTVYYPDLAAGVCKFDGNHATSPYQFATAEECCDNRLFDYIFCMKKTNPYIIIETDVPTPKPTNVPTPKPSNAPTPKPTNVPTPKPSTPKPTDAPGCMWHPNPFAFGTCKYSNEYPTSWEGSSFLYDSYAACCDVVWKNVGCKKEEVCDAALNPPVMPTPEPTREPTPEPKQTNKPTSSKPTLRPTTVKPTPRPTVKYTIPPVVKSTIDASKFSNEIFDGFEDGLTSIWPWATTPDLPWSTDASDKFEGKFSARSQPVLNKGDESDLHVAITSPLGGMLDFWVKSDVQMPFSGCYINMDGESRTGYTYPTSGWESMAIPIPPGQHVVMFRVWRPNFSLPPGGNHVSHTIRIDSVRYIPTISEGFESGKLQVDSEVTFVGREWGFDFDPSNAHEGNASLRSPIIDAGQSSTMKLKASASSEGSLISFWYMTSVFMPIDKFTFTINGKQWIGVSTQQGGWKKFTTMLSPGESILEWSYVTSPTTIAQQFDHPGEGRVWIDDILIVPKA